MHRKTIIRTVAALLLGALIVAACSNDKAAAPSPQAQGQAQTATAFAAQSAGTPYPADKLSHSLERDNLAARLVAFNNPNKIGYLYLLSFTGQPIGFYTIKGKISSPSSQMTTDQLIVNKDGNKVCCDQSPLIVNAPGDDGSYGPNEPGIFFFTTEGTLVETSTPYIYSDQPLPLDVPKLNAG